MHLRPSCAKALGWAQIWWKTISPPPPPTSPICIRGWGPGLTGSWHFRNLPAWILHQVWMDTRPCNCGAPERPQTFCLEQAPKCGLDREVPGDSEVWDTTRGILNVMQRSVKSILKGRGWIKGFWEGAAHPAYAPGRLLGWGPRSDGWGDTGVWTGTGALPLDRHAPILLFCDSPQVSLPSGTCRDKWPSHYHGHATLSWTCNFHWLN